MAILFLTQFLDHCGACLVSIVLHFSLEDRTTLLIVTVHCYCCLYNLILAFFKKKKLWSVKALSEYKLLHFFLGAFKLGT